MAYLPLPRLNPRPPGARSRRIDDVGDLTGGKRGRFGKYVRYEFVMYFDYLPDENEPWDARSFEVRVRYSVGLGESPIRESWKIRSLAEEKMIDLGILVDREGWGFKSSGYRLLGRSNTKTQIYKIAEKASTHFTFPKKRWGVLQGPDTILIHHQVRKKIKIYFKKRRETATQIAKRERLMWRPKELDWPRR